MSTGAKRKASRALEDESESAAESDTASDADGTADDDDDDDDAAGGSQDEDEDKSEDDQAVSARVFAFICTSIAFTLSGAGVVCRFRILTRNLRKRW